MDPVYRPPSNQDAMVKYVQNLHWGNEVTKYVTRLILILVCYAFIYYYVAVFHDPEVPDAKEKSWGTGINGVLIVGCLVVGIGLAWGYRDNRRKPLLKNVTNSYSLFLLVALGTLAFVKLIQQKTIAPEVSERWQWLGFHVVDLLAFLVASAGMVWVSAAIVGKTRTSTKNSIPFVLGMLLCVLGSVITLFVEAEEEIQQGAGREDIAEQWEHSPWNVVGVGSIILGMSCFVKDVYDHMTTLRAQQEQISTL